ncbi:MAG: prolyl oligopeptidase family serine peptidase [Acidobacteriota bacterium]
MSTRRSPSGHWKFATFLFLVAPLLAGAQDPLLEQVLGSAPFPSSLTAAPEDAGFAWVFNDRGVRNVWFAEAPDFEARRLTSFDADDGQELGSLTFTSDGERLFFVRGGAPNARGELPNPRTFSKGVGNSLWSVELDGGEATRFGEGYSPFFLDDATLGFFRRGDPMKTALSKYEPERLLRIRGSVGNLRASPEGERFAFVSSRGTHSFVGLFDPTADAVRFLAPGVDRDQSPVWSPDGSEVAFLRLPTGTQGEIFEPLRAVDEPWSIVVVDVDSGDSRTVFEAFPGAGSAYRGTVAPDQIVWTASGHLIFPWERDGWTHLWSVPASGGEARNLTPGAFEVEAVAALPDGSGVAYSSNQGDIDRRHLWRVGPGDAAPQPLTSGDGVEQFPTPAADGTVLAFLRADGRTPLHPALRFADGREQALAPAQLANFPVDRMTEPAQVIFDSADGLDIHGQLFLPPARFTGPRPAVIFFHGGSRRHMMLGWHYSSYYHHCYAFHQYMANQGYVVLSVNYRSGIGYGLEFREALNYGASGASEFNDVLGAGLYLAGREDVDADRIGLWGGSYGGYLTALGLARASSLFAAGVDIHGVHDWNRTIQNFVPSYEPLEDPERARLAFESSPLSSVDTWQSPVLLIHGDDDRNVPFAETVELVDRLRERDVEHELVVFPDEVHGFLLHSSWLEVFGRAARFFEHHLAAAAEEKAAAAGG